LSSGYRNVASRAASVPLSASIHREQGYQSATIIRGAGARDLKGAGQTFRLLLADYHQG
jgi:hypothetical protein